MTFIITQHKIQYIINIFRFREMGIKYLEDLRKQMSWKNKETKVNFNLFTYLDI